MGQGEKEKIRTKDAFLFEKEEKGQEKRKRKGLKRKKKKKKILKEKNQEEEEKYWLIIEKRIYSRRKSMSRYIFFFCLASAQPIFFLYWQRIFVFLDQNILRKVKKIPLIPFPLHKKKN